MSYGDDEHKISIVFEPRFEGAHVKVVVRSGLRGMRGLAGELTFRPEDWSVLREALGFSREADDVLATMIREAGPGGVNPYVSGVKLVYLDLNPIELTPEVTEITS